MEYGGCVGLSIPDSSKLNEQKALDAFTILWGPGASTILRNVPRNGGETGATFTKVAEDYDLFEQALVGSGVEAELLMKPWPRAMLSKILGRTGG